MERLDTYINRIWNDGKKTSSWIVFIRVFFGLLMLFEVTIGHNWKLFHPGWMGAGAGDWLREDIAAGIEAGTWPWAVAAMNATLMPYAELWSYLVLGLQLFIAVSLILGVLVRPVALLGGLHTLPMFLTGNSRIPPFFTIGFIVVFALHAGMHYGLDKLIVRKLSEFRGTAARVARYAIEMTPLPDGLRYAAIAAAGVGALYFGLEAIMIETGTFRMVSLDMAYLLGIVLALLAVRNVNIVALTARMTGLFVGIRMIHEWLIRTEPAMNGLPGSFSTAEGLVKPFAEWVTVTHYAPLAWVADQFIIPAAPLWVVVFGVVQIAVGFALFLGFRSRTFGTIGLIYLGFLLLMGFTRYTAFVVPLLVLVWALDDGSYPFSLDRLMNKGKAFAYKIPSISLPALAVTTTLFAVTATLALVGNMKPDQYKEMMGPFTAAMFAIALLSLGVAGLVQNWETIRTYLAIRRKTVPIPEPERREPVGASLR